MNVAGARVIFSEDDALAVAMEWVEQSKLRSSQTQADPWHGVVHIFEMRDRFRRPPEGLRYFWLQAQRQFQQFFAA